MKDLGSYDVAQKVNYLKNTVNKILNPKKESLENYYAKINWPRDEEDSLRADYVDSIFMLDPAIKRTMIEKTHQPRPDCLTPPGTHAPTGNVYKASNFS